MKNYILVLAVALTAATASACIGNSRSAAGMEKKTSWDNMLPTPKVAKAPMTPVRSATKVTN